MKPRSLTLGVLATLALGTPNWGQSDIDQFADVRLGFISSIQALGHTGTRPTGTTALAISTTICNEGQALIDWFSPMNANHPLIVTLIAREFDGRIEQISDWSYVKHGFFALASSQCTPCQNPNAGGTLLGLGCSDTYGVGNNGDNFWLGPPDEIDPFNGLWDPLCSLFDLGTSGTNCDGARSFNGNGLGPLGNRVKVEDAALNEAGATYWYQGYYVVKEEQVLRNLADDKRHNNFNSRRFVPIPSGSSWNLAQQAPEVERNKSVLERWVDNNPTEASIDSVVNYDAVADEVVDGRVYVAWRVREESPGNYRYEYAFHNRDNKRGVNKVEIPICTDLQVTNAFFKDVDLNAGNDWTLSLSPDGTKLVAEDVSGTNPLRWNTIYNVGFNAPVDGSLQNVIMHQADPGPGNATLGLKMITPKESVCPSLASATPFGCGPYDATLTVTSGLPTLGGTVNFEIDNTTGSQSSGFPLLIRALAAQPNFPCGLNVPVLGGELLVGIAPGDVIEPNLIGPAWTTPGTPVAMSQPIPNAPALLGVDLFVQALMVEIPLNMKLSGGVHLVIGN